MIRFVLLSMILLALVSCETVPSKSSARHAQFAPVAFSDLDGWNEDAHSEALVAFQHSCKGGKSKASGWQQVCNAAEKTPLDDNSARNYFEKWFQAYAMANEEGNEGLFTGYYAPELKGALQQGGAFQIPLYARPHDLISVDLGAFKSDLQGQHIVGKVDGSRLIPYDDRATIVKGSLATRAEILAWVDDPASAFFLEVQGSGRLHLTDGTLMPIGYDGANGRAYVAIGRVLADRGDLPRPVTMPAIRQWLTNHPEKAQEIMNANASYVFFRRLPNDDVIGAEGIALTPSRSLAVDPSYISLGTPVWLETTDGHGGRLHRLMVAQDTGGAIKGAVRGDFFWGFGDDAAEEAGTMQSRGHYFILLPQTMHPDDK